MKIDMLYVPVHVRGHDMVVQYLENSHKSPPTVMTTTSVERSRQMTHGPCQQRTAEDLSASRGSYVPIWCAIGSVDFQI